MIKKIADIKPLVTRGRGDPTSVFAALRQLAASNAWQTREVAATALVEISKRHPAIVAAEARRWARDADANVRRAASEGLRGVVKQDPASVWPVLDQLREDPQLYVRKSVASVLRNASGSHPEAVLALAERWSASQHPHTNWILRAGLQKLRKAYPDRVEAALRSASPAAQ